MALRLIENVREQPMGGGCVYVRQMFQSTEHKGILLLQLRSTCSLAVPISAALISDFEIVLYFSRLTPFNQRPSQRVGRLLRWEFVSQLGDTGMPGDKGNSTIWIVTEEHAKLDMTQIAENNSVIFKVEEE